MLSGYCMDATQWTTVLMTYAHYAFWVLSECRAVDLFNDIGETGASSNQILKK